jgi:hypothetical protein
MRYATFLGIALVAFATGLTPSAIAGGRLLATGGVMPIEGQAGGGIVPWAVIAGYGTRGEIGGAGFYTHVSTDDYDLDVVGVAVGIRNRVELSATRQEFDLGPLGAALGRPGASIRQDVLGAKLRIAGSPLYTAMPQISVGLQYKRNLDFEIPSLVGARDDEGVDLYLSATKVFLGGLWGRNWLLNGTLRATRANQTGLVGFGGDRNHDREAVAEVSAGVFLSQEWIMGAEYRQKPDNLSATPEDDWRDVFIGWFPNKHWAVVGAYVDLGEVATLPDQRGLYLSIQGSM